MIGLCDVVHCRANRATDAQRSIYDYNNLSFSDLTSNQVRSLASVALKMELSRNILFTKGVSVKRIYALTL